MKVRLAACTLLMIGLLIARPAMALFDTFYLFSEVKGTVLHNGQPVQGARVEQHFDWAWKNRQGVVEVLTDARGEFSFSSITDSSILASLLPHEPVIVQKILIHHHEKSYDAWLFVKHNYDENGELAGTPIKMTCNLEDPPVGRNDIYGICTLE